MFSLILTIFLKFEYDLRKNILLKQEIEFRLKVGMIFPIQRQD